MAQLTEAQKKIQSKIVPFWINLLKKNKVPDSVIPFTISQIILESNWFTSNPYLLDNNPAGITWNNNYLKRPGASLGRKRPPKEGGNYVRFDNYDSAAKDYVRIINIKGAAGKPIDSTSYQDYAKRLGVNGYYDKKFTTVESYAAGLKAQLKRIYNWLDIESLVKKKTSKIGLGLVSIIILYFLLRKKNKK
jgi:flagellum-specific peptidoglycan hydrolase FlgJ